MAYRFDLDAVRRRDARIAELEHRTDLSDAELDELFRLIDNRAQMWRRMPTRIADARRVLDGLLAYADSHGLPA